MQQEIESLITQTLGDNARFTSLTFRGETWDAWIRPTLNYNNELDPDDELIERHYLEFHKKNIRLFRSDCSCEFEPGICILAIPNMPVLKIIDYAGVGLCEPLEPELKFEKVKTFLTQLSEQVPFAIVSAYINGLGVALLEPISMKLAEYISEQVFDLAPGSYEGVEPEIDDETGIPFLDIPSYIQSQQSFSLWWTQHRYLQSKCRNSKGDGADDRDRAFEYDTLGRQTKENWLDAGIITRSATSQYNILDQVVDVMNNSIAGESQRSCRSMAITIF